MISAYGDEFRGEDILVSVIMPVRNELRTIDQALDAVLDQDVGGALEVVVADGRSDDGTRELLDRRAAADPRIVVVDNPDRSTPQALNVLLGAARGRYVVRVDGHTIVPQGYVNVMISHLRSGRAEAAGGLQIAVGRGRFGRAVAALHGSRLGIGGGRHHHADQPEYVDHITQGAYVTELCRSIGGFDRCWQRNQDCEFDLRYAAAGGRLLLDPSLGYHWYVRESPRALAKQYFQYGYWRCRTLGRHPSSLRLWWLVPPALVASLAVSAVLTATPVGAWALAAVLGAYCVAVAAGMVSLVPRTGIRAVPALALALATIHLSWGSGFLISIPKSLRARRRGPTLASYPAAASPAAAPTMVYSSSS
jgi:succinoglycan biosynthesis protein ExoA